MPIKDKKKNRLAIFLILIFICLFLFAIILSAFYFSPKKPNYIVFISVDTLRADHLSSYGYRKKTSPVIDSIAKEGVLFEKAFCQRGITLPSLASIMTGKYINQHMLVDNVWSSVLKDWNTTLAEYLKSDGYYNKAFNANFIVTPPSGIYQGFDEVTVETDEEKLTNSAVRWLSTYIPSNKDKKVFLWLHYFDPHIPYEKREPYYEEFKENDYDGNLKDVITMTDTVKVFNGNNSLSDEDIKYINAVYDSQIRRIDGFIEKIISALKKLNIYDKTLLIFSADHGEEILEHNNYIGHFCSVYNNTLHIPLIMRYPDVIPKNKRYSNVVESIDIMPTILHLCRIPYTKVSGLSLMPIWEGRKFEKDYAISEYWNLIFKINTADWSYIWNPTNLKPTEQQHKTVEYPIEKEELYHLKNDSKEMRNLIEKNRSKSKELYKKILNWIKKNLDKNRWPDKNIKEKTKLDPEQKKALKSLGYL